ncbi:5-oxoprolinase subunit PxpB [Streptomyces sp. NPDC060064]|uniref:5-oxoprolinase subunit PxpB n=1 Tax=Streptomyces sp. NPDC060064 TaxID=3347049 RepID=UPI00368F7BD3
MRLLTAGSRSLLIELENLEQVLGLHNSLRDQPEAGIVEMVPAAHTLLIVFDPAITTRETLAQAVSSRKATTARHADQDALEIPVGYDGPDLAETAQLTGLTTHEVIQRHTEAAYTVAFGGFAPGFAYISGLDPLLHLPRRSVPRTQVPAGAVAIADRFTCIYPRQSPGGWNLIGHTPTVMWDLSRTPPALLLPGRAVRFVQVSK